MGCMLRLGPVADWPYSVDFGVLMIRRDCLMPTRLAQKVTQHFDDEIRFFKNLIEQPKAVGAVLPTSASTARKMVSQQVK